MSKYHSLLERQLRRCFGRSTALPEAVAPLVEVVDAAYREFDSDRAMLERSLELSSQELLLANSEMRALLRAMPDLILRLDAAGVIRDRRAGRPTMLAGAVVGARFLDVVCPEVAAALAETLSGAAATGAPSTVVLTAHEGKVERSTYEARVSPMPEGELFIIIRDITEERQMEARLLASDRLASFGMLAAGVAHEINNPLTYTMTNLSLAVREVVHLQEEKELSARDASPRLAGVVESLRGAEDGAERVRQISRDLRTFSREVTGPPSPVDVRTPLEAALRLAHAQIAPRARLVRRLDRVPLVLADPRKLAQVFLNILVNAAQAIPEPAWSGRDLPAAGLGLAGAPEPASLPDFIRVRTGTDPLGRAEIEIADSGPGMTPAVKERIFEPFYTTKAVGEGTGLGLSICKNIVAGLGGEISVDSSPGAGTVFRILIPAAEGLEADLTPSGRPSSAVSSRILIIDDEPKVGVAIARALEHIHDAIHVTSPLQALQRLEHGEHFDLILCDLSMPEMTGYELCAVLEARHPELLSRVVLISGHAPVWRGQGQARGGVGPPRVLQKPIDIEELLAVIAERRGSFTPRG